jgi:hypothetical protein
VSAYDHARRAVTFLRWNEEDVDEIAPSLYAGRTTAGKKSGDAQATRPAVPPADRKAPAGNDDSQPAAAATGGATAATGVGMPGSEPFLIR